MDYQTATPAQIDTALAAALAANAADTRTVENYQRAIDRMDASHYSDTEARTEYQAKIDAARDRIERRTAEVVYPGEVEFDRRGGWTRYFLVTNTGGHVHTSTACDTCFETTQYAWLTEQSGMTAEALVDLAGTAACTICFPWAPVDTLNRPTRLEAPDRKAARLEREAKAAERAAKKAAKAITATDGGPLEVFRHRFSERVVRNGDGSTRTIPAYDTFETLATLHAARGWLTDQFDTWGTKGRPEDVQAVTAAISAKESKPVEKVTAEARQRAAKRR